MLTAIQVHSGEHSDSNTPEPGALKVCFENSGLLEMYGYKCPNAEVGPVCSLPDASFEVALVLHEFVLIISRLVTKMLCVYSVV